MHQKDTSLTLAGGHRLAPLSGREAHPARGAPEGVAAVATEAHDGTNSKVSTGHAAVGQVQQGRTATCAHRTVMIIVDESANVVFRKQEKRFSR